MALKESHMTIELKGSESLLNDQPTSNQSPGSGPSTAASSIVHHSNTFMKYVSLVALTLQNALSILLLRYVRTVPGERFIKSTAVITSEFQKTILSILLLIHEERNVIAAFKLIYNKIVRQPYDTFKTGIPALLYTLQNNLLFIAISNLDAATFQVSYQLKIFTTAVLMVIILRRQLNLVQWFALFLLFLGISLVQVENMTSATPKQDVSALYGLFAVMAACTLSGLAGVYFEKILKGSDVSVWIRNIQLGIFGMFFGALTMYLSDGAEVKAKGFLYGYTNMVWIATLVHSVGGLIVALVVKHADNILKGFATSAAIVLSCIVSMMLFDFELTILFTLGSVLVIFSIFLYSKTELILYVPILNTFINDRSVLFQH
ncbi:unnamed protein product [Rotaria magnacalcarata]|uniref:UDP-N-acetylglucosamine transporter n=4 Tax=Rotaria magnacalcarata TaxID=392030 RepID=A0A816WB08_9BILA|nr:unnamed protein product [Rotaria magnacalcarata]CAF1271574.1 unnamed protein product [Rotaria magnacalcarata]CAF1941166.1 unnamed protein product [Rotaria magnacalcarata]CAF2132764.1 unnamed protein product [Rotaria magnacalcarata]CAF2243021.1 unnamed protein product [Rotaria magnacalcarata]